MCVCVCVCVCVCRVGHICVNAPYMTANLVVSLPKIPYMYIVHTWFWPTLDVWVSVLTGRVKVAVYKCLAMSAPSMMCTRGHWQYCMYAVYYMHYQSYHATSAVLPAHVLYYQCSLTSATILPVHVLPELPCYQCSATSACTVLPVQPY